MYNNMEKINIAEFLKDCPKGMELDCTIFDGTVILESTNIGDAFPINIRLSNGNLEYLTKIGGVTHENLAKCVIFPKGKTTWEGFVPPCKFKDGDVLFVDCADKESDGDVYKYIFILKEIDSLGNYFSYCHLSIDGFFPSSQYLFDNKYIPRLATEEEKAKLFKAIKDNGYKWNAETKTLEKLVEHRFKVGNRIRHKNDKTVITITGIKDNYYLIQFYNLNKNDYQNEKVLFKDQDKYELVPEFKDGDVIVCENHWGQFISIFKENVTERDGFIGHCVLDVDDNEFKVKDSASYFNEVRFATKREKKLLFRAIKKNGYKWNPDNKTLEKSTPNPDKFDITNLKPFDKVLVRDTKEQVWVADLFSHAVNRPLGGCTFACVGHYPNQCIPYEDNKHLLGTNNDCNEYFKIWEN